MILVSLLNETTRKELEKLNRKKHIKTKCFFSKGLFLHKETQHKINKIRQIVVF
jgi:hypothetical protein